MEAGLIAREDAAHRVMMVVGAYPPDVCGVGDYTANLMEAAPSSWQLFVEPKWSLSAIPGIVRRLLRPRPTHVVVQYPSQGYGWSIVPHLLIVLGALTRRYRPTLALHEFGSLSAKAQLCLALCSHFVDHIIFTTEVERDLARRHPLFSSRAPSTVIGIISNIPAAGRLRPFRDRATDIAYFGHIRPNKGIEAFLEVTSAVRNAAPKSRIGLIGEVPEGYEAFADTVMGACRDIACEIHLGLDEREVAEVLSDVKLLYLAFPDGISARRGSALAGMNNGALVMSKVGPATPYAMEPAILAASGTKADAAYILRILDFSNDEAGKIQLSGHRYIESALPRNWSHVAELYASAIGIDPTSMGRKPC